LHELALNHDSPDFASLIAGIIGLFLSFFLAELEANQFYQPVQKPAVDFVS
jgi:hypothetical protein